MGWLRDKIDSFVASYISNFFWNTKWASKQALKSCETTACAEKIWEGLDDERKADPEIIALYEDAKARGEQNKDLGIFGGLPGALYEGFDALKDTIEGKIGETLTETFKPGSPEVTKVFEDAMDTLLDGFLNTIDPGKEKIPTDLRSEIKGTIKPMLGLGLTFTVGSVLAELIHPTKEMGFGRVSHFLYDTIGFKSLMDAYIAPIRLNLISQPTKYNINELTRPFAPRLADALEWYGRGHIDEDEMEALLKKHGTEDGWGRAYQRMGTKPSSYFMLNAIGREGLYDEADFKFWLSDAGYGAFQITRETLSEYEKKYKLDPPKTTQIDFLAATYKRMAERVEWAGIQVLSKKAVKEGLMDVETLRTHLARGYRKKEVDDLEIELLEMDIKEEVDKEYRRAYEKKYLSGRITKEELEKKYVEHGLQKERAKARLEYMFARKQGKLAVEEDERVLTKAEVIRAYNLNQKGKGWAIKQIDDQGYTTEDASLLVDRIDVEKADDVTDEWIRAAETRTLNGRMTISNLTKRYIELGKEEDWAEARAAYIEERLLGKVVTE